MVRKAVDVVLLPDEVMMDRAIEANRELAAGFAEQIVLNKEDCLPHISLAMGCVDEKDTGAVEKILTSIAKENRLGQLRVIGVSIATNAKGEKVSVFGLERSRGLQSLHEQVMKELSPYLTADVTAKMVNADEVSETTLLWIKHYREKSSFSRFLPHITIGYGQIDKAPMPVEFAVCKLALCHLGNHCTCSRLLISIDI